jgi:hypothetical protein
MNYYTEVTNGPPYRTIALKQRGANEYAEISEVICINLHKIWELEWDEKETINISMWRYNGSMGLYIDDNDMLAICEFKMECLQFLVHPSTIMSQYHRIGKNVAHVRRRYLRLRLSVLLILLLWLTLILLDINSTCSIVQRTQFQKNTFTMWYRKE